MTRRFAIAITALLLPVLAAGVARAAESVPGPAPQALIETAARQLLEALDADREQARKDPARVRKLVDEILLPHFDTDYSARLVLGKHWRTATPEQRRHWQPAGAGHGIHWPDVDEDLSTEGLLRGIPAVRI